MKTEIEFTSDDQQHKDWKKGDLGYIDGYLHAERPYACIVKIETGEVVLAPLTTFKAINLHKINK